MNRDQFAFQFLPFDEPGDIVDNVQRFRVGIRVRRSFRGLYASAAFELTVITGQGCFQFGSSHLADWLMPSVCHGTIQ
jgi:hypothetical protein